MALAGKAFLAIWNGVDPAAFDEWNRWHTVEHMPERMAVPGFLIGRRYLGDRSEPEPLFTLYEGLDIEVFRSPAYLARLNDSTPWSARLWPTYRNMLRGACRVAASHGRGMGGYIATARLHLPAGGDPGGLEERLVAYASKLAERPGIVGAHVGITDHAVTNVRTREKELRGDAPDAGFDAVLMVETYDRAALEAERPGFTLLPSVPGGRIVVATYDLAFVVSRETE